MHRTQSPVLIYVVWLVVLSLPFWAVGALVDSDGFALELPISALMTFNPLIVAALLVFRENGGAGTRELLRKPFHDWPIKPRSWYLVIFLLMPTVIWVAYGLALLLGRSDSAAPGSSLTVIPLLFAVFLIAAYGEEVGWQGYLFERLQPRWGSLGVGCGIGIIWAIWHIVPLLQLQHPADWIVWQCLFTVLFRLMLVWVYLQTGRSLFAAIVVHATSNTAIFMIPTGGSGYDPLLTCLVALAVAVLAVHPRLRLTPNHSFL